MPPRHCAIIKDDLLDRPAVQFPARERDFFPDVRPFPDQNRVHAKNKILGTPCVCLRVDTIIKELMSQSEMCEGKAGLAGSESDSSSGVRGTEAAAGPLVRTR